MSARITAFLGPFCGAILLAGLLSCQSVPQDQVARTPGEPEMAALDTFDLRLLDLRLSPDPAGLGALRADLDRAAGQPGLSRRLQARVTSLRGEAALLARDLGAARRFAEGAAALSDADQGAWVVRAGLERDPAKRLALLQEGAAKSDGKSRLLCERGSELLKAGRYAEAAQDLDEGLRALDPRYRGLYGADRDRAFALAQASRDAVTSPSTTPPGSLEAALTVRAMVAGIVTRTDLLSSFSPDPKPSFEALLPALKQAGLLLDPAQPPDSPAPRKTVAYFLWGVVARTEHDQKLLTRYRLKYVSIPVPDVAVNAQWFDAVLGVVEREIMDLPDGASFEPDAGLTGLEYLAIIGRLKRQYP
jgi:hypothetical protein